ncbi:MAG: type II toxin-antitoxin system VapC family toxin [Chloroflexota bacterium]
MTSVVLDTHALLWWATEPERMSERAAAALRAADELVVAPVTWWELAWLVQRRRLRISKPLRGWLHELASGVRTAVLTPAVATSSAELPGTFPKDPFDRLIYATAIENGLQLVSADRAIQAHDPGGHVVVW